MDYGRYGSFYVYVLENLDTTHPGVKKELKNKEISVRQNTFEIGQAVDMAGEQTYILYICLPEMIPILEKVEKGIQSMLVWFSENFFKANAIRNVIGLPVLSYRLTFRYPILK